MPSRAPPAPEAVEGEVRGDVDDPRLRIPEATPAQTRAGARLLGEVFGLLAVAEQLVGLLVRTGVELVERVHETLVARALGKGLGRRRIAFAQFELHDPFDARVGRSVYREPKLSFGLTSGRATWPRPRGRPARGSPW